MQFDTYCIIYISVVKIFQIYNIFRMSKVTWSLITQFHDSWFKNHNDSQCYTNADELFENRTSFVYTFTDICYIRYANYNVLHFVL